MMMAEHHFSIKHTHDSKDTVTANSVSLLWKAGMAINIDDDDVIDADDNNNNEMIVDDDGHKWMKISPYFGVVAQ